YVCHALWNTFFEFDAREFGRFELVSILFHVRNPVLVLLKHKMSPTSSSSLSKCLNAFLHHFSPPFVLCTLNFLVFALKAFAYRLVTSLALPSDSNATTY